jgi:hypothetical protein
MFKKMAILMCLLAISLLAGCGEYVMSAYSDEDVDNLGVRAGAIVDRFEVGVQYFRQQYDENECDFGPYAKAYLNPGADITPYVGVQTADEFNFEKFTSPFFGIDVNGIVLEYQPETPSGRTDVFMGGYKIKW